MRENTGVVRDRAEEEEELGTLCYRHLDYTGEAAWCYLKVDLYQLKVYIVNSKETRKSFFKGSIIDMLSKKIKQNHLN